MMSDDMLSQEEIDALLRGSDDKDYSSRDDSPLIDDYLNSMEQDALGEIGNISFGSSATALSTLLNQKVDITTPAVSIVERNRLKEEFPHPYVAIQVNYTNGFSGVNLLVIKQSDAAIIADLMLGGDGISPSELLGEIQLSAVQEAMNQMMGSAATSMSTIFNKKVDISPPSIDLLNITEGEGEEAIPPDHLLVKISFRLKIGNLIDSTIMQLLPVTLSKSLVSELFNVSSAGSGPAQEMSGQTGHSDTSYAGEGQGFPQNGSGRQYQDDAPSARTEYQTQAAPNHSGQSQPASPERTVDVQPASFASFQPQSLQQSEMNNLDMLLDIPLQVTVELGRTKRSVKELLELSSGSIIELDKLAGEPVDILVNKRLIAKGEVVVIDENFGVRVTDILSQTERLKKLR